MSAEYDAITMIFCMVNLSILLCQKSCPVSGRGLDRLPLAHLPVSSIVIARSRPGSRLMWPRSSSATRYLCALLTVVPSMVANSRKVGDRPFALSYRLRALNATSCFTVSGTGSAVNFSHCSRQYFAVACKCRTNPETWIGAAASSRWNHRFVIWSSLEVSFCHFFRGPCRPEI